MTSQNFDCQCRECRMEEAQQFLYSVSLPYCIKEIAGRIVGHIYTESEVREEEFYYGLCRINEDNKYFIQWWRSDWFSQKSINVYWAYLGQYNASHLDIPRRGIEIIKRFDHLSCDIFRLRPNRDQFDQRLLKQISQLTEPNNFNKEFHIKENNGNLEIEDNFSESEGTCHSHCWHYTSEDSDRWSDKSTSTKYEEEIESINANNSRLPLPIFNREANGNQSTGNEEDNTIIID